MDAGIPVADFVGELPLKSSGPLRTPVGGSETMPGVNAVGTYASPNDMGIPSLVVLTSPSSAIRLILPFFSGASPDDELAEPLTPLPVRIVVSSRNDHAGT